jgi:hypothetical protein
MPVSQAQDLDTCLGSGLAREHHETPTALAAFIWVLGRDRHGKRHPLPR